MKQIFVFPTMVFSHSRVPDKAFYRWFIKDYLIDFISNVIRATLTPNENRVSQLRLHDKHAKVEFSMKNLLFICWHTIFPNSRVKGHKFTIASTGLYVQLMEGLFVDTGGGGGNGNIINQLVTI